MARTKQTARKSTGGIAPRAYLSTKGARAAEAEASSNDDESVEYLRTAAGSKSKKKSNKKGHEVFGYDKWPFGAKGEPQEVISPRGDGCKKVSCLLAKADDNAGEYSFGGVADTLPAVPGIYVEGLGDVSVPLCPEQADKLITICDKSPFGRKLDTMMDESVRKSWQLAPDKVDVKNPLWQSGMDKLIKTVASRLGYKDVPLQCKLYKLLVYGEGGHFVKHQDTEKEACMIATMVVQLPSLHEGGDLVVYRGGEVQHRHDFGKKDGTAAYLPHYAVHYADAEHALKEVTKGFRLVLIYSICLPPTMRHLMKDHDGGLSDEVGAAINAMGDEEQSFALLLSHEYTGKSIEELGSGALKSVDRSRFQVLEEANCVAAPGKKLQFFLAQLKHDISYWDDGGSWVEGSRNEKVTWFSVTGQKLGHTTKTTKIKLNLLNPGQETLSELWALHGNTTFEGYLGNEGATKDTTYSRYAIVAWPAVHGVENAFKFINVNAAVEALECQRPVDAVTIRKFMDDVKAKLAQKEKSYSWSETKTVSVGFCRTLCSLLVELGDASLVNLFLKTFVKSVDDFKKKNELAAPFTLLACNFEWNDIDQALLDSLSNTGDVEFICDSDDEEEIEDTDDSRMAIALEIIDGLDTGAAQQALLKFAVEKASRLRQANLCSSKALPLLWKWVIRCGDKTMFDTIASKFDKTPPSLLQPVIESFSQHLGTLPASDDRFKAFSAIANKRIEWLNDQLQALGKPFSWEMPDAYFPDNARIQAFLRGPESSMNTNGVRHFNGVGHARNYAKKWMREKQVNASFALKAEGRGGSAYVVITKTRAWFSQHQKELLKLKTELALLSARFGVAEGATSGGARKRARHE